MVREATEIRVLPVPQVLSAAPATAVPAPTVLRVRSVVPVERVITVAPETGVIAALRLMQQHDIHQLPVLEHDRVVGMVTRSDVLRRIEVRSMFGESGERRPDRDR